MGRSALLHLLRSQSKHRLSSAYFHTGQRLCRSLASPRTWSCRPSLTSATQLSAGYRRWLSQSTAAEEESKISGAPRSGGQTEEDEKVDIVIYHGPVSTTIRKVKLLSLSSCFFSVMLGPVITFMTLPNMSMILKGAMASSVLLISASTTAALHWVVSPYIHKMKWQPGSDSFEVETMSWLATYVPRTIRFSDIRPPETNRPVVTFKANGKFYYVDEEHCHDKALLARLTPTETSRS
ncbi:hypothetical protein BT93_E0419 [Corymbia citriodora subsp. variegata]|nr:hypothetical protein BT93_E0419 [Corymbia citriodora subsp. variegata]